MIPYCQLSAEEEDKTGRSVLSEKGARKAYLCGLSSLAENMMISEFTSTILSLAHSLPKMHSRLWEKMHTAFRQKQHLVSLRSMYRQMTVTLKTGRWPTAAPIASLW